MTENNDTAHDTEHLDTMPPPPPSTPPPAAPPAAAERPPNRWRNRRVGIVTLAVSTGAALVIGGTLGAVTGGAVGYGVGQHDHPDRPSFVQLQGGPQAGLPNQQGQQGQQFQPPNGELPPGMVPNGSDDSDDSSS